MEWLSRHYWQIVAAMFAVELAALAVVFAQWLEVRAICCN